MFKHVPQKDLPLPAAASQDLQQAIADFPSATAAQSIADTPITVEQWRDYIQIRNADQKKKIKKMRKALEVDVQLMEIAGVKVRQLTPKSLSKAFAQSVYIDIHGGAYVLFGGLPSIEEGLLIAHRLGITVYSVDYRMPPSAPFPAALDDVLAVYQAISARENVQHVFVGGTSAGGGLVLSLMQSLLAKKLSLPLAIYAGTPWADLNKTGDSLFVNEGVDSVLVTYDGQLSAAARLYAGKASLSHPLVSPLYGSFEDFPPTFLLTGTRDMFLSDTVRVNRKIRDAGGQTQLEVFEGVSHAQHIIAYNTPESLSAYQELKQFFLKSIHNT